MSNLRCWRRAARILVASTCAALVVSLAVSASPVFAADAPTSAPSPLARVLLEVQARRLALERQVVRVALLDTAARRRRVDAMLAEKWSAGPARRLESRERSAWITSARAKNTKTRNAARRAHAALKKAFGRYVVLMAFVAPHPGLVCPVAGDTSHSDDWGAPRSGGRHHEGNDVFAKRGTPAAAIGEGTATRKTSSLGGNTVWIELADGTRFFHAHLDRWNGTFPRRVRAGDVVGFVGTTGNARGGAPHLHFEWHPGGGEPVNPYPLVGLLCDHGFDPSRLWSHEDLTPDLVDAKHDLDAAASLSGRVVPADTDTDEAPAPHPRRRPSRPRTSPTTTTTTTPPPSSTSTTTTTTTTEPPTTTTESPTTTTSEPTTTQPPTTEPPATDPPAT